MKSRRIGNRLHLEELESRFALSFVGGLEGLSDEMNAADAKGGAAPKPAIRLDLVALHEFGHSLGLAHSTDKTSIMYSYYNGAYNPNSFSSDSAVSTFQSLYANVEASPWKDSRDPLAGNGVVDLTYSFVPDGTTMDKGTATTYATFNAIFGAGAWQGIFSGELGRWASNSGGRLAVHSRSDAGKAFNYTGLSQNDPAAGDVRIAAHRFDGAGKVLAHAYYPPPNGSTAAGDAHFDSAENWVLASSSSTSTGGGGSAGALTAGHADLHALAVAWIVESEDLAIEAVWVAVSAATQGPAPENLSLERSPVADERPRYEDEASAKSSLDERSLAVRHEAIASLDVAAALRPSEDAAENDEVSATLEAC